MSIGVTNVHFADVPGHVLGLEQYLDTLVRTVLVDGINVVHPHRHPDTLVGRLATLFVERGRILPSTTSPLTVQAEEYLALARADSTKRRRISPIPAFLPAELLEPLETLLHIGNVENRRQCVCNHFVSLFAIVQLSASVCGEFNAEVRRGEFASFVVFAWTNRIAGPPIYRLAGESRTIESTEVRDRCVQRQDGKREACFDVIHGRRAIKRADKVIGNGAIEFSTVVQELTPERHRPKSTVAHASRFYVDGRKEPPVRIEVVQPRRSAYHCL